MCRFIANEAYYKGAYPACLKQYGLCMHQRIDDWVVKIFQLYVKRFVENSIIIIINFYILTFGTNIFQYFGDHDHDGSRKNNRTFSGMYT